MVLQQECGGYARGEPIRLYGSFTTRATSAPDQVRDGNSKIVSVVRTSTGLYTVTLDKGFPIPEKLVHAEAQLHTTATPTVFASAKYVTGSWSQSARTFQIVTTTSSAVADPDTGDRISFELVGSISSVGTDPA